ncbi:acetate uptake transporter [Mangrovitalea sediminis]|uniref:acetate uptake transporter n=1 Tax=Mangrovitalea sediminis TaxID=1982043 RepID=UPI000BE52DF8|nr:acetate uptake transporter family protein [Mangrovitalea sediminis]
MTSNKLANPAPLGLIGFASTTWLLSMHNAGWFSGDAIGLVLAMAFAFGGTAQMIAGIMEYPTGNTFGTVAFISYGAFWWSFALFVHFFAAKVPGSFIAWYLFVWGVFTFYMWIATFRKNRALQLIFLALWITFLLLALGIWMSSPALTHAGGYVGMLTAILAGYLSAAEVINESFERTVLPVGPYQS